MTLIMGMASSPGWAQVFFFFLLINAIFLIFFPSHDSTFNIVFFKKKKRIGFIIFFILLFIGLSRSHHLTHKLGRLPEQPEIFFKKTYD